MAKQKQSYKVVGVKPGIIISSKYGKLDLSNLQEPLASELAKDPNFPYLQIEEKEEIPKK